MGCGECDADGLSSYVGGPGAASSRSGLPLWASPGVTRSAVRLVWRRRRQPHEPEVFTCLTFCQPCLAHAAMCVTSVSLVVCPSSLPCPILGRPREAGLRVWTGGRSHCCIVAASFLSFSLVFAFSPVSLSSLFAPSFLGLGSCGLFRGSGFCCPFSLSFFWGFFLPSSVFFPDY